MRLVGKPVGAIGQKVRQPPREERILDVAWPLQTEQDSSKPGFTRQQQVLSGFRLEASRVREGAGLSADVFAHVWISLRSDEPDRNRRRRPTCNKNGVHYRFRALISSQGMPC